MESSVWDVILRVWNTNTALEDKSQCLSLQPLLCQIISGVADESIHTILNILLEYPYQSSFISTLFQQVLVERIQKYSLSCELLFKLYRVILQFLPPQAFLTTQPNFTTLHFLHQLVNEEARYHLQKLVDQWNIEFDLLSSVEENCDAVDALLLNTRSQLLKQILSNKIWLLFLKKVDSEKNDPSSMRQFIFLLSEFLVRFGVSTVSICW